MKQPINFVNNTFIYDNGERKYFNGEKEYISLPDRNKIKVGFKNIWNCIKPIFIPISQMSANIMGIQFRNVQDTDKLGFYDLECDDEENFVLGYVNDKKFENPVEMVKQLIKYDVLVAFNGIKFDNNILKKYAPDYFIEIKNADFSAFTLNGKLIVDMLSIIKINVSLESYSAEYLAKYNKFPEEILKYSDNKDDKCKQDIRILKFLYEKYNIKKVFNKIVELSNLDTTLMQIIQGERLRKWILINKYLKSGFLPLQTNKCRMDKVELGVVKYFKEGLYEDYRYDDVSSTYPTEAINLGNLGIYDDDNTFSELQKELKELSQDNELKPFMKSIANSLFGVQYSLNEHWRNDDIFEIIVKNVAKKVGDIIENRKDVVYSNTDCWIIPQESPKIEIKGYNIKTNHEFKFLYIYNNNKWIGKTKERIEFRGFKRLNSTNLKMLYSAREEILSKLFKTKDKEEFKELLDDTEKLVSKTLKKIKKFPKEDLKITIRKTDEYCKNLEFASVWNRLKIGFNDIYYGKDGNYVLDYNKICFKHYKQILLDFAKEYSTSK